jgi:FKBP-type peptidyl-prolyl cis-trans isomerase FklB
MAIIAFQENLAKKHDIKTQMDSVSYAIGINIGKSIAANTKKDSIKLEMKAFLQGIKDAMERDSLYLISDKDMQSSMMRFEQQMVAKQNVKMKQLADKNMKAGDAFLAANKQKPGVVTLESGLQYQVIKSGSGASPKKTDKVKVDYVGTLLDGKEFDSSIRRGQAAELELDKVIPGWTEALQKMKVGDKWKLFIPGKLAYGERGAGQVIGPNETLIFEVELLEIVKK